MGFMKMVGLTPDKVRISIAELKSRESNEFLRNKCFMELVFSLENGLKDFVASRDSRSANLKVLSIQKEIINVLETNKETNLVKTLLAKQDGLLSSVLNPDEINAQWYDKTMSLVKFMYDKKNIGYFQSQTNPEFSAVQKVGIKKQAEQLSNYKEIISAKERGHIHDEIKSITKEIAKKKSSFTANKKRGQLVHALLTIQGHETASSMFKIGLLKKLNQQKKEGTTEISTSKALETMQKELITDCYKDLSLLIAVQKATRAKPSREAMDIVKGNLPPERV